ncbi:MAG: hypothetical protein GOV00_01160 [Candidatus Altiarchaeota archaeon]|nr:hypothetical protein [Candidatus Altiarchaeota archaeon]
MLDSDRYEADRQSLFLPRWDKLVRYVDPERLFLVKLSLGSVALEDSYWSLNSETVTNLGKSVREQLFDAIPLINDIEAERLAIFETYRFVGRKILEPLLNVEPWVKEGVVMAYASIMLQVLRYTYLYDEVEDEYGLAVYTTKLGFEETWSEWGELNLTMRHAYDLVCELHEANEDGAQKDFEKIFREMHATEMSYSLRDSKNLIPFEEKCGPPGN